MHQTVYRAEPRYLVVALFTVSMIAASLIVVGVGTLVPHIAVVFPDARTHAGIFVTMLFLGSLLTTAVAGALTDRFGDKAVLLWSGIAMSISLIASALVPSLTWMLCWFFVYGIAFAAVVPAGSHAILFFFTRKERGFAMGLRQTGIPLGGFLGALLFTTVGSRYGYAWALIAAGLIVGVVSVICSALYLEPAELQGERIPTRALLTEMIEIGREPRLLLLTAGSMALICPQMVLIGFFPITLIDRAHFSIATASSVFAISQVAAVAGRLFWGWLSDRYFGGNRVVALLIVAVLTGGAAFAVGTLNASSTIPIACAVAIVLGFAGEGWFGLSVCAMAEIGGEEHAGSALGFGLTWVYAMAVVAPVGFNALVDNAGYPFAWTATAVISCAAVLPLAMLMRLRVSARAT